jgi:hypothetical protein
VRHKPVLDPTLWRGFAGEGEGRRAGEIGGDEVVEEGDVFAAAGRVGLGGDQLPGGAAGFGEEVFGARAEGLVDAGGVAEGDAAEGGDVAQDDEPGVPVFPEAVGARDVGAPTVQAFVECSKVPPFFSSGSADGATSPLQRRPRVR